MKWCCVPDCSKFYNRQKEPREPLHMFGMPRDQAMLAKWRRLLPNKISASSTICHQHFDDQFLHRYNSFLINGETVLLAKHRWTLSPDAVPHIFPTLPAHYSHEIKRRKPPKSRPPVSINVSPSSSGSSLTGSYLVPGSSVLPFNHRKNLITSPDWRLTGRTPTLADAAGEAETVVDGPRLSDAIDVDGVVLDAVAEAKDRVKAAALRDLKNTRARMQLELKLKNLRRKYYVMRKSTNRLMAKNLKLVAAAKDAKSSASNSTVSRVKPQKVTLSARQERLAKVRRFSVEDLPPKPRVIVEAIFRKYRLEAENKRSGVRYHPEFIESAIALMRETPMGYRHCLKHELLPLPTVSLLRQIQRKREKEVTPVAAATTANDAPQDVNAKIAVNEEETVESAMVLVDVTVETHEEIVS